MEAPSVLAAFRLVLRKHKAQREESMRLVTHWRFRRDSFVLVLTGLTVLFNAMLVGAEIVQVPNPPLKIFISVDM